MKSRDRVALSRDDIVLEPELFHGQTYGWQVGESRGASGGCYLHIKEGVGDYESEDLLRDDPSIRSGDFYNVTGVIMYKYGQYKICPRDISDIVFVASPVGEWQQY